MSWQAGILLGLAATLIGGVIWYERSRPPSQVVALVAALAALAVAGRVAFSPIPNVVPTTDIALISGYALGPAPGFAVGAMAALVSNFWLGQGPWTPWQMAGWGMTGLLGAFLARATGLRLGRIGLAAACGAAAFAYGALLDLSLMVSYGGEQSVDRFLALSARGLPFNVAHAAGNVALALVAGPALVRMLVRYRRRFEFAWPGASRGRAVARGAGGVAAAALIAALAASLAATGPVAEGAKPGARGAAAGAGAALAWLQGAQNSDGGFGAERGVDSHPAMTGWAALGIEAAGRNPLDLRHRRRNPIAYLRGTSAQIRATGDIERTILVLAGAGLNPRRFQGRDLVRALLARRAQDGSWEGQVNLTAFGILALEAAGRPRGNRRAAAWLRAAQNEDGGWGYTEGASSDPDSTGAVLQAVAAAGVGRAASLAGARWLRGAQRRGGGFALSGGPVNAQSTAWATQGLIAAGVPPASVRRGGRSPLDYLASVQAGDGHYRYSRASDQSPVWVTAQALLAVSGRPFPLDAVPRKARERARPPAVAPSPSPQAPAPQPPPAEGKRPGRPPPLAAEPPKPPSAVPPPPLEAAPPEPTAAAREEEDDTPAVIASAAFALLVAAGCGWMLHRQDVG